MEIKYMKTMKYFVINLNSYIGYKNLISYKVLSEQLNVKYGTLESWLIYQRVPTIVTIDSIANMINVQSEDLIGKSIDFKNYSSITTVVNNSPIEFYTNLRKYLNIYDIKNAKDFVAFLDNKLSVHAYYSYYKSNNQRIPSVRTLEFMADYFNIEPYQLIERNDKIAR